MGGFTDSYDIERRYGHGDFKLDGDSLEIRVALMRISLFFSTIFSLIIFFFINKKQLKKQLK